MIKKIMCCLVIISVSGCSAVSTAVKKQDLLVETRMSESVVLEPMAPSDRLAYVRVRDTSGNGLRKGMQQILVDQLASEGIRTTLNPKEANLMLNATILQAGKSDKSSVNSALASGFAGGALAGGLSSMTGSSNKQAVGAGLAGAALGFLADTMIEDVYYSFIIDVELRERPLDGDSYENASQTSGTKGTSTKFQSNVQRGENYKWLIYKTRIVTTANQMNLKLEDAMPIVQQKTAMSLSEVLL
jgi:hypothetical protein